MATKSQLKQYFETGKIPTQAQFGELINSFINIPYRNTEDRGNQNLFFGNGEENPYIQGVRTVSKIVNTNVITMFIFSTHNNNDNASSFPLFILNRTSTRAASLNNAQERLRYCIPNKLNIDTFVMHGLDCDNSTDDEIITEVSDWEFKPFGEGGSTFPRVAYIDSQSAWNTWYNNFKAAHDENETNGKISSINIEGIIIDNCTFIIESQIDIIFKSGTDAILFKDCFFQFENTEDSNVNINFSGCRLIHSYISGNCNFQYGTFENCTFDIGTTINNATIYKSYITANKLYKCNCSYSTICNVTIEDGNVQACDVLHSTLIGLFSSRSKFYSCQIKQLKLGDTIGLVLYGCSISSGASNPFAESTGTVIQGFIWGCDFSNMSAIPGVMKGAQCCKFRSTLLSSGVIMADLFGNKSAATNGMNTGV
jgi:uncharacterized protein YjbI with pentapeptide repeats